MDKINPLVLRTARKKKNMTLDDLAQSSKVDRGTISKIELGKSTGTRSVTIERLAKALDETRETLTSSSTPEIGDVPGSKSPLGLRIENANRNALQLVARHYGIAAAAIVEVAPFLFVAAAEASLRKRTETADRIDRKYTELREIHGEQTHLHHALAQWWQAEEALVNERESIEARDIFGLRLENDSVVNTLREDYDDSEHNPFVTYLRELAAANSDVASFDFWFPSSFPHYTVCRKDALALVGGDEDAADAILRGTAPLHELPKELRNKGQEKSRADWACKRAEEAHRRFVEDLGL